MNMTKEEIVRDYTQAANKSKQIKVLGRASPARKAPTEPRKPLADLNCCSPGEIKEVLAEAGVAGVKMPERVRPRKAEAGGRQNARAVIDAGELSVYDRIETILAALPGDASEYVRNNAYNLVVALFSAYVEKRVGKGAQNET